MPRRRHAKAAYRPVSPPPPPPAVRRRWPLLAVAFVAFIAVAVFVALNWPGSAPPPVAPIAKAPVSLPAATYVGQVACAECHRAETDAWKTSQHAKAMQHATDATVLGRFDGATFTNRGVTSTFFRRDGKYFVRTDGADGKLADFEIKYTFGVDPLQQYLVEFPGGRMQALTIAWDARPRDRGGQRWFTLYPDEKIDFRDPLHWTRLEQNWNSRCADCHSTNLVRNYDAASRTYDTKWSDMNVACEACHGPGSNHVAWARKAPGTDKYADGKGIAIALDERRGVTWTADAVTGNATRSRARTTQRELDTCAVCHGSRHNIATTSGPTGRLGDTQELALLRDPLYFADGQQQGEVYDHASFLQSKMHAKGVTCSDCHDPHSGKLRADGNALCAQCHSAAKYDAASHTMHGPGSFGVQCAACHMPTRTYMVVDPRHDHSFRIPRPDRSASFGAPNACNDCHRDRDAAWAASAIASAHGPRRKGFQTFGGALHAGRTGAPDAAELLRIVAFDPATPGIARATAIALLERYPTQQTYAALERAAQDADPLVRAAALDAVMSMPPDTRGRLGDVLAADPVLAVRAKAGRVLAAAPGEGISDTVRARRERAMADYVATQEAMAERPESHLLLGVFYVDRQDVDKAEAEYRAAIRLQPDFAPAYVNLADLYLRNNREPDIGTLLAEGLKAAPNDAGLLHAMGLLRIREKRVPEALPLLKRAADAQPSSARYAYVYGVGLQSVGRTPDAIAVLQKALERSPNDADVLAALALYSRQVGRLDAARGYTRHLAAVAPDDPRARQMSEALAR